MKITLIIVLSIACIYTQKSLGQQTPYTRKFVSELYQTDEYIKRQNKGISYEDTNSYVGSPYNDPNYLLGNVYKNNELWANDVALRYNAVADEIEIKESLDTKNIAAKVLTKSPDIYVKIVDDIYIFVPYKGGIEHGGYFLVLFEGEKISLFKKPKKKFTPAKKATNSITRDLPASFSDKPVYYIVDNKGKYYEFPSSKNKKLKVFGANKDVIKKYVQQQKLNLNKEKDLLQVIKYYDTF